MKLTREAVDALIEVMNKRVQQYERKATEAEQFSIAWYEARAARRAFLMATRDIEAMEDEQNPGATG